MEYSVRYFVTDEEKKILHVYHGVICQKKLFSFLNSLPKSVKEKRFPILKISRENGEVTCNLEKYFKSDHIKNKCYRILEYQVKEEDVDNKVFLNTDHDCETNAYDIYLKWEEMPEITNYASSMKIHGKLFTIDFSIVFELLNKISASKEKTRLLLKKFMECFAFDEVGQISLEDIQFILNAEQYPSLRLEELATYFKMAYENGRINYKTFNPNAKEQSLSLQIVSTKDEHKLLVEAILKEKNPLGQYVSYLDSSTDAKEIYGNNQCFFLNVLSEEEDLYTYKVDISFSELYKFMVSLNQTYSVVKEKIFEELEWDCYENKPILTEVLEKKVIKNNDYRILEYQVKEEDIHIRQQKVSNVYVKWEESIDLIRYIYDLISLLTTDVEVDWSNISKKIDVLPNNEEEKKRLYYNFFSCFHFGKPIEIIPSDVIKRIENYTSIFAFNLDGQKYILKRKKELGAHNREFFSLLLETRIVNFPNRLSRIKDN